MLPGLLAYWPSRLTVLAVNKVELGLYVFSKFNPRRLKASKGGMNSHHPKDLCEIFLAVRASIHIAA